MGVPAQQQRSDAVPVTVRCYESLPKACSPGSVSLRRSADVRYYGRRDDSQTPGRTTCASDPAAESIMHTEHALLHALYDSTTDTHLSQQGRVPYAAHESDAAAATVAVVEGSLTSNARALF